MARGMRRFMRHGSRYGKLDKERAEHVGCCVGESRLGNQQLGRIILTIQ